VMVTHELDIAQYCKRILVVRDGLLVRDEPVQNRSIASEELAKLYSAEQLAQLTSAPFGGKPGQ
jgi:putative ABC transport system ATP-binding protein